MSMFRLTMRSPCRELYKQAARNPICACVGSRSIATVEPLKIRALAEGETLPSLKFSFETGIGLDKQVSTISTADLFAGKRCVVFRDTVFARNNHYPFLRYYEKRYEELKSLGIDEVYFTSPNNSQVMRQWLLYNKCEVDPISGDFKKVKPLQEGCQLFTSIGLDVWSNLQRFSVVQKCQRYAIVVKDAQIEKVFKENAAENTLLPVAFKDANADKLITYLQDVRESVGGYESNRRGEKVLNSYSQTMAYNS